MPDYNFQSIMIHNANVWAKCRRGVIAHVLYWVKYILMPANFMALPAHRAHRLAPAWFPMKAPAVSGGPMA